MFQLVDRRSMMPRMNLGRWWLALALVGCGTKPPDPEPIKVARLELSCPRHSVAAYDSTRSLLAGPSMACTARVTDVAGTPLVGVQLHLLAEAGRLTGGSSNTEGAIELLHEVAFPLPLDVEPASSLSAVPQDENHTGQPVAPEWMRPEKWGTRMPPLYAMHMMGEEPSRPEPVLITDGKRRINNPRDNLVTLVAWVDGAEPLDDTNGNGVHDPGETFVDLTEPFVDANDDGTWNQGEAFVDTNGNRQWDGKNLSWDQQTNLWVQERVLWTGLPSAEDVQFAVPGVVGHRRTFIPPQAPQLVCLFAGADCPSAVDVNNPGSPGVMHFYMADPWFNAMTRPHTGNGCVVSSRDRTSLVNYGRVSSDLDGTADAPDGLSGTVTVTDVRDPSSPQTNRPRASPPLPYRALIRCQVSDGSPTGTRTVIAGGIEGTIE